MHLRYAEGPAVVPEIAIRWCAGATGTTRGATALAAGAPAVAGRGGPLGGARGTW